MKLSLASLKNTEAWNGYRLPQYDPAVIAQNTRKNPRWLHFGAGNIFRVFPAVLCQRLIEQGRMDTGIICCESYDEQIITRCFRPYDNLSIAVTLNADGSMEKEVVASMTESLSTLEDSGRIAEIFETPSLQIVSFTITEKGYALRNASGELLAAVAQDMKNGPAHCQTLMGQLGALCIRRYRACGAPLALVSMDNCSHNGEKLQNSVLSIARAWKENGQINDGDFAYLNEKLSFPWSMIDKITPRPNESVEKQLIADGLEDISPFVTSKNTYTAAFVNAEKPQYLVIENDFPNGCPPLEDAGVYITDRDTVNRAERMKVTTCLNPLHTAMSVYGCMLGYRLISEEMGDQDIVKLIKTLGYKEGLAVVTDPKIISPQAFIDEVVEQRLPNPFMPDAPQRIATDTSLKVGIRFGETIKSYLEKGLPLTALTAVPLAIAGWLRYLLAVDDNLEPIEVSADPMKEELQQKLKGIIAGKPETYNGQLKEILSNQTIFGCDLMEIGLGEIIEAMFIQQLAGKGAVRAALKKYLSESRSV